MTLAIETAGLSRYRRGRGPEHVLSEVSLAVPQGACVGLLGANGAGKSTLIKMLLGLAPIGEGTAQLFGRPVPTMASREGVGYLPEHASPLPHLTGREHLELFGQLAGLAGTALDAAVARGLADAGLAPFAGVATGRYSKGMLQKLELARVMLTPSRLLVLDEPMTGLDATGQLDLEERLAGLVREGVTILVTSHALHVLEHLCDHFALLRRGRLVRSGPRREILKSEGFRIALAPGQPLPAELPAGVERSADGRALTCADRAAADAALARVVAAGAAVESFGEVIRGIDQLLREVAD